MVTKTGEGTVAELIGPPQYAGGHQQCHWRHLQCTTHDKHEAALRCLNVARIALRILC